MKKLLPIIFLLCATKLLSQTNTPISAIDWLSQPGLTPLSENSLIASDPSIGAILDEISVVELDAPLEKSYGLIPAKISGIPKNFWTDVDPKTLYQMVGSIPELGLPATDDFLLRALLAETAGGEAVLGVRVNTLLNRGAVHAAYNLLGQSQINNIENFNLLAETSLLTDNVKGMCNQLNAARHFSDDEALQVYCHSRAGSWDTAVLNYFTLNTLGAFTPTTSALLAADLDPELAFSLVLPEVDPSKITALEFKLRASVGQPVPTLSLPLKFVPFDLINGSGWVQKIKAAERLGAVGSLPAIQLLEKYKSGKVFHSDRVWNRALAVQALDRALADPIVDPSVELLVFWDEMQSNKLIAPLARAWADKLVNFRIVEENNSILFKLKVLSSPNTYEFKPTMARLRRYNPNLLTGTYENLMIQLAKDVPESQPFRSANMLRGMRLISDTMNGNESALLEAITLYQAMGLTPLAKQLAMEFFILAPGQ